MEWVLESVLNPSKHHGRSIQRVIQNGCFFERDVFLHLQRHGVVCPRVIGVNLLP
jgi:hypothetical protein